MCYIYHDFHKVYLKKCTYYVAKYYVEFCNPSEHYLVNEDRKC